MHACLSQWNSQLSNNTQSIVTFQFELGSNFCTNYTSNGNKWPIFLGQSIINYLMVFTLGAIVKFALIELQEYARAHGVSVSIEIDKVPKIMIFDL